MEAARRQQAKADERYRRSMDNAAIGMCLIDPDGRFVEVNDALCQLFGYDAETLKRTTWQELTAAGLAANRSEELQRHSGRPQSTRIG